ncbi:MAG: FG-GAP-like repeat-containing protein, partial [Candidatus Eremiobacterota bacterium]
MRYANTLVAWILLAALVGCGEDGAVSSALPAAPGAPATTRTITVRHSLLKAVPATVTHFRFTGSDAAQTVVFGPDTRAKAPQIVLVVPDTLTSLLIEYLEGTVVVGTFTVQVVFDAQGHFLIEDPAWVDVQTLQSLQSIQVAPVFPTIPAGLSQAFTATGTFTGGTTQDLTGQVVWSADDPSVLTMAPTGVATAVAPGTTTVRAALGGVSGSMQVTVASGVLTSIAVTPLDPVLLSSCDPYPFSASGTLSDGTTLDLTQQVDWSTTNPAVATVSSAAATKGSLRTTGPGTAQVRAALGGVAGASDVTVVSDPIARYPSRVWATGQLPTSVAVGDLNADGRLDLATANSGSNDGSVLLGNGDGTFQAAQNFPVGPVPDSVALGDLNGDGRLDLATTNRFGNNASVLLGNGDGTFLPAQNFPVGVNPHGLALGDVNGDGRLDLAAANLGSDDVAVLLGNGDGTLQPAQNFLTTGPVFPSGTGPVSVSLGDVNGDNLPDLVTANLTSADASVLLGNGDGTFQAAQTFTAGAGPVSVSLGDVNADTFPDLVTANRNSNDASVLLGNGDGTFQAAQNVAAGANPGAAAVSDVNGDGRLDLLVVNLVSCDASVRLGNGDGTFLPAQSFATGVTPIWVALGDVNNDGRTDLASANLLSDDAGVLLGNGDGTFQSARTFPAAGNPSAVAVGDVNGDGRTDLATADQGSDTASVLLGNGDGTFQAAQSFATGTAPNGVALGDVNGDGRPDLTTANGNSN